MIKIKDKTGKKIPIDLKEMPGSCWVQNSVDWWIGLFQLGTVISQNILATMQNLAKNHSESPTTWQPSTNYVLLFNDVFTVKW